MELVEKNSDSDETVVRKDSDEDLPQKENGMTSRRE
jgi:hypothetical protein